METESAKNVSVLVLTFNNADFIFDCLKSIESQTGDTILEVIVWDNGSTDKTIEVITKTTRDWSVKVQVNASKENHYVKGSGFVLEALALCKGKYVAMMDGDDVWVTNTKLRSQIQALEENPALNLVATRAEWYNVKEKILDRVVPHEKYVGLIDSIQLSEENFICNSSVVIRKSIVSGIPTDYSFIPIKDYPLWVWSTRDSQVLTLPEITTRYNFNHGNNVSQSKNILDRFLDVVFTKVAISRKVPNRVHKEKWLKEVANDVWFYFTNVNPASFSLTQQHEELIHQRDEAIHQRDEAIHQRD
jgi:glycosyltransferase involved in cell wall biosynthesis